MQWFVEGEGIEHRVIQTDLPRYLGNGATLRRGMRDVCLRSISSGVFYCMLIYNAGVRVDQAFGTTRTGLSQEYVSAPTRVTLIVGLNSDLFVCVSPVHDRFHESRLGEMVG
jgi:hypothetical protein